MEEATVSSETAKGKRTKRPPVKARGLFERDGEWWICWSCALGHIHREKIGPKSLALSTYQKRKVAVRGEGFCLTQARMKQQVVTFNEAVEKYLAWAERERPRSLKFRRDCLKPLTKRFGASSLEEISRVDVESYVSTRRDEGAGPATCNRERSVLSHLFSKCITWGIAKANPVVAVEKSKEPNEKPRPLSVEEEARFFAALALRKRAWRYWREAALLSLNTGLRLNELREQAWRDIDLPGATLRVTRPKSGQVEYIPLNQTACSILAGLERTSPLVFPTFPLRLSDDVRRIVKKAGLPADITWHCLRDTYISRLAPHVSAPSLMALARHRDFRTTRRYLKVADEHLREAVEHLNSASTSTPSSTASDEVSQLLESIEQDGKVE